MKLNLFKFEKKKIKKKKNILFYNNNGWGTHPITGFFFVLYDLVYINYTLLKTINNSQLERKGHQIIIKISKVVFLCVCFLKKYK